jgi:RNA:NAD 2'-phosphotransferase (TPT1/KptA family)
MATLQALCMKCRTNNKPTMRDMVNPVVTKNEKGRYSAKGTCAVCGGNMFKFMSGADGEAMMAQ